MFPALVHHKARRDSQGRNNSNQIAPVTAVTKSPPLKLDSSMRAKKLHNTCKLWQADVIHFFYLVAKDCASGKRSCILLPEHMTVYFL